MVTSNKCEWKPRFLFIQLFRVNQDNQGDFSRSRDVAHCLPHSPSLGQWDRRNQFCQSSWFEGPFGAQMIPLVTVVSEVRWHVWSPRHINDQTCGALACHRTFENLSLRIYKCFVLGWGVLFNLGLGFADNHRRIRTSLSFFVPMDLIALP